MNKITNNLKYTNPSIIPRNHVVEKAINMAVNNDFKLLDELINLLEKNLMMKHSNKDFFI